MEVLEENNHCFGCLCECTEDEYNLQQFNIQCEQLRTVLQMDKICLCYVCKRIAQRAESFIQNVQSNQIFLQNCQNKLALSKLQKITAKTQPSQILTKVSLNIIELTETDVEESITIFSSKDLKTDQDQKELNIKLELKEEGLDHLEGEFIDGNDDFPEHFVKKEDDFPLSTLVKDDIDLETIDLKSLRRTFKKKKDKHNIVQIRLSDKQCKKERDEMAQDAKYLESTYKCEDCIKGYMLKECYDRHMEAHDPSRGKFNCKICRQRFESAKVLLHHKKRHLTRFKCEECDFVRATRPPVQKHLASHSWSPQTEYRCTHCSKSFSKLSLRKHKSYAHKQKQRVACAHCHKTYVSKESLRAHMVRKHLIDEEGTKLKRYSCEECGASFGAPSQLRNHSAKHSVSKDFYCVECDKSFKTDSVLKHHLKTAAPHVSYLELPLPCEHCDKRFAIRRDLIRHTNRIHLDIRPYACDRCDKAYLDNWSLREHQRYSHEGGKRPLRYPCTVCDKVFDRNSILKSHMRTHTGERPYQCSRCPAQFAQGSALGTHIKLIHLKLTRDGRPKSTTLK